MSAYAVLFPGQGSQHLGMGADLARAFPIAKDVFERGDQALDFSLSSLCWNGPEEKLTQTENAQPAILVHSYAVWSVVREVLEERVAYAAGHSLGEFTAYAAADSLDFEDAVRLVRRRGELMAASRAGSMAAVVGLAAASVEEICERASGAAGVVVAANYNSPQQIVMSGDVAALEQAVRLAKESGAKMVRSLAVSGAFHSPLMADAEEGLKEALAEVPFRDPRFPVVCNATAEPVRDSAAAREALLRQLTSPVRWTECVQRIASAGTERYVELGPGNVLTRLLRRIDPALHGVQVGSPEEARQLGGEVL